MVAARASYSRAALGVLVFGVACQFDENSGMGVPCDDEQSCAPGLTCFHGYCIEGADCDSVGAMEECYTGEPAFAGVGECRVGQRLCAQGTWGTCLGEILPSVERCNGLDDDCDGVLDEIAAVSCETSLLGVCSDGALRCVEGSAICTPSKEAAVEVCNGEDDDCDGALDEGTELGCFEGSSGCIEQADGSFLCEGTCSPGVRRCEAGELGQCTGQTRALTSDGCTVAGQAVDEDCDGKIDEDCSCEPDSTQECYGGPAGTEAMLPCKTGRQRCVLMEDGYGFGSCEGERRPIGETCDNDGVDDDCDGVVDNIPSRGDACTDSSKLGACRLGEFRCSAGALRCSTPDPQAEMCDEVDNDCDGKIDETFSFSSDRNHCGGCGVSCSSEMDCCSDGCKALQTDPKNCGRCGATCPADRYCNGGNCCPIGLSWCARPGTCVDFMTDDDYCGGCNNRCTATAGGSCRCTAGRCTGACE